MSMDKRWLAAAVFALLIVFSAGVKYSDFKHDKQEPEDIILQSDITRDESETVKEENKAIEVYVTGAVKNPGVYRLKEGDRVHQAVELAGGVLEEAETRYLEMARPLIDGETIPIPGQGEVPEIPVAPGTSGNPTGSGRAAGGRININTASAREMADSLDGIGPALGQRIVDYRDSNGRFKDIEEIKNVSGIGDKRFEALKDQITVR